MDKEKECDWCEGLGFRTVSVEGENGVGEITKEECEKCHGNCHMEKENNWEEELQFGIMENYIMTAELGHFAKDQVKHKEELRSYWIELKDFIHKILTQAIQEERNRVAKEIHKMKGWTASDCSDPFLVEQGYELALSDALSVVTNQNK